MNIAMLLEMAAESFPERIAVTAATHQLSYPQLLAAARTCGALLHERRANYAVMLDTSSLAMPVMLYGAAIAGLPFVPINYRLTGAEQQALIGRVTPAVLVASPDYSAPLRLPADTGLLTPQDLLRTVLGPGAEAQVAYADQPDTIAVQLFTSGTTGQPKAAVLRHEHLMAYVLNTVEFGAAAPTDATLIAVPPYHVAAISAVLSSTYAGRRMVQLPNFDAAQWLDLCSRERVTHAFLVPTMLARIIEALESSRPAPALPALRAVAYGGGRMPVKVIERALQLLPQVEFTNAYGLTETSSTICLLDPADHRAALASDDPGVRKRLGSVGRALPAVELELRGSGGEVLAAAQVGEVFVRGPQVSGEYLGLAGGVDQQGWFATRDRGYLDAAGYLFLEGRADDVIVRGGENISPGEIEAVLMAHPAIADAAVVGVPSEQWGEAVGAAVVLKAAARLNTAEIQAWVRERLRSSRVPEVVAFRSSLPYNEMGKVLRRVVKSELGRHTEG
jgi:acyl-CoA synthetase (AMP-forming)/AMP-acid ligase II